MKNDIYGGSSFPFVTSVQIPIVRWIMWAAILSPFALIIMVLAAVAYLFF